MYDIHVQSYEIIDFPLESLQISDVYRDLIEDEDDNTRRHPLRSKEQLTNVVKVPTKRTRRGNRVCKS